jgi:hypothetical protein
MTFPASDPIALYVDDLSTDRTEAEQEAGS